MDRCHGPFAILCLVSVAPVEAVSPELMICLMHADSLRCFPSFLSLRFASRPIQLEMAKHMPAYACRPVHWSCTVL